jgi:hypothetical protein
MVVEFSAAWYPGAVAVHCSAFFQVARVFASLSVRENLLVPFLAAGCPGGDERTELAIATDTWG